MEKIDLGMLGSYQVANFESGQYEMLIVGTDDGEDSVFLGGVLMRDGKIVEDTTDPNTVRFWTTMYGPNGPGATTKEN